MADGTDGNRDEPAIASPGGETPASSPNVDAAGAAPAVSAPAPSTVTMAAIDSPPLAPEHVAPPLPAPEISCAPTASPAAPFSSISALLPPLRMPKLSRRARWRGTIAAGVVLAAGLGAAAGAVAVAVASRPPAETPRTVLADQERAQLQGRIAQLGKDVAALKASLETVSKTGASQIARLNDKLRDSEKAADQARRAQASETTGSIGTQGPVQGQAQVPVPMPRPVTAAVKPALIDGWFIRSARDGLALVEGYGEIYEAVPGAPLPGLGRVEAISRRDGRWVVVTQKGVIAAMRPAPRAYYRPY